jgi:riboflavin biosynthesis pyrimidine reductase
MDTPQPRPLPETLSLVYHAREAYPREVPLADVYRLLDVPERDDRPAVIVNMVQTLDGVVAIDGKAWSIGSEVDHFLFRTLRGWADVVLSGAGTLRHNDVIIATHEHLRNERLAAGRPANPLAVVVSRRADFPDEVLRKRYFTRRDFASMVVTTELATPEDCRRVAVAGAEVVVVPAGSDGGVDMAALMGLLAARGLRRVLCEGGPETNRKMVEGGLIDELFVTVAAQVAGDGGGRTVLTGLLGSAAANLRVISEYQHRAPAPVEWFFRFALE